MEYSQLMSMENSERLEKLIDNAQEQKKADIKNALTLPKAVLQFVFDGECPPKEVIQEAQKSLSEAINLLKSL